MSGLEREKRGVGSAVIAVDGPCASGKGTVSKAVATSLGLTWIDTGALYRATALLGSRAGIDLDDGEALKQMIEGHDIALYWRDGGSSVVVDGDELGSTIRTEAVGQGASRVALLPEVREALLELQRSMARAGGVVMDGRDIGSVVLPDADLKVYLTASLDERARRRFEEQVNRGINTTIDEVKSEVSSRDDQDRARVHAPLIQAPDAVVVDTTLLTPVEAVEEIVSLVVRKFTD